jgi:WhiB family redox-sensing transcriptional regulator
MTTSKFVELFDNALCKSYVDQDLWFSKDISGQITARSICAICPVERLCLEFAEQKRIHWGIWGGKNFNYYNYSGPKSSYTPEQRMQAYKLHQQGMSIAKIAETLTSHPATSTIREWVKPTSKKLAVTSGGLAK